MAKPVLRSPPKGLLRPYLSAALLKASSAKKGDALLKELTNQAVPLMTDGVGRTFDESFQSVTLGGLTVQAHIYSYRRLAPWATRDFFDESRELAVLAVKGDMIGLSCSEPSMRDRLLRNFTVAVPLPRDLLERAFVGTQARAMWLTGVHTPTASKANAKAMTGPALELALDPLGDQSFYYSAVKSSGAYDASTVIGAAPSSSRIWLNRPKDWETFATTLESLIDHSVKTATLAPVEQPWLKVLAQSSGDVSTATDPYAVALISPDLLSEAEIDAEVREQAITWAYKSDFEIIGSDGPSPQCRISLDGEEIGTVEIRFREVGERSVGQAGWTVEVPGFEQQRKQCASLIARPDCLRVYFADGTTLAEGRLFSQTYRDQRFDWTFDDFTNYAVTDEKPQQWGGKSLADVIAAPKQDGTPDNSLFAYVIEKLFPTGWLASDDGSMEFADFVHINPAKDHVTLIHAKGANKDDPGRGVSVANYEVVVSQAVKNVRHLDRSILADILESGSHKKIAGAVWLDKRKQADRIGIIAAAKALQPDHKRTVMVLQPQLTEKENNACVGPVPTAATDHIKRMKQLDTLMLSAKLSCGAVGADFVSIGAK